MRARKTPVLHVFCGNAAVCERLIYGVGGFVILGHALPFGVPFAFDVDVEIHRVGGDGTLDGVVDLNDLFFHGSLLERFAMVSLFQVEPMEHGACYGHRLS